MLFLGIWHVFKNCYPTDSPVMQILNVLSYILTLGFSTKTLFPFDDNRLKKNTITL